jgi:Rrf2 family protein
VLSQTAQYALRTVLLLAQGGPEWRSVDQLAEALDVPRNYLAKTLSVLARTGVVASTRGKHGGFRLGRPARRITLRDVVAPFDDVGRRVCLLGRPTCSDRTACPVHARWKTISMLNAAFFARTTVAELRNHQRGAARASRLTPARSLS